MNYIIYKLTFSAAVHIGEKRLTDAGNHLMADTLFSALCTEAAADAATLEKLVAETSADKLLFSDAMPYISDSYYISKPMIKVDSEQSGDSVTKKNFKKLKYIPIERLTDYLSGNIDPIDENETFKKLGAFSMRSRVSKRDEEKMKTGDALPYEVGSFTFSDGCGLYFILGYETEDGKNLVEQLLQRLAYSGIGGKRSSGFGRFTFNTVEPNEAFKGRLMGEYKNSVCLCSCMAKPEELETALEGASYLLLKRSGFIQSASYAGTMQKKRDFYSFKSGSCFKNRFVGDIFDVSGSGNHPVYRYAKPMFMGVD